MEKSDFSVPRRMSKSAFVILLVKGLVSYAGPFLIWAVLKLFNTDRQRSFVEVMRVLLFLFICYLVLSVVTAFISYYYKKYYIKNGNLILIYGFLKKETTIPLQKVQSLRTRRGFMYRLLDMKGVSFDTLASKEEEVELILDYKDWDALL